jgi:hypothetical protein
VDEVDEVDEFYVNLIKEYAGCTLVLVYIFMNSR